MQPPFAKVYGRPEESDSAADPQMRLPYALVQQSQRSAPADSSFCPSGMGLPCWDAPSMTVEAELEQADGHAIQWTIPHRTWRSARTYPFQLEPEWTRLYAPLCPTYLPVSEPQPIAYDVVAIHSTLQEEDVIAARRTYFLAHTSRSLPPDEWMYTIELRCVRKELAPLLSEGMDPFALSRLPLSWPDGTRIWITTGLGDGYHWSLAIRAEERSRPLDISGFVHESVMQICIAAQDCHKYAFFLTQSILLDVSANGRVSFPFVRGTLNSPFAQMEPVLEDVSEDTPEYLDFISSYVNS